MLFRSLGVRTLLDAYECCESDLHGRVTVLVAAGLLEETEVAGERGYRLTEDCKATLEAIRELESADTHDASDDSSTA